MIIDPKETIKSIGAGKSDIKHLKNRLSVKIQKKITIVMMIGINEIIKI
jgi:hypothetical protein